MANKLTLETGRSYFPEDILICNRDRICDRDGNAYFKRYYITENDHYKYIFGTVYFYNYNKSLVSDIKCFYNDVDFSNSQARDLGSLQVVMGVDFKDSFIKSLGNLKFI